MRYWPVAKLFRIFIPVWCAWLSALCSSAVKKFEILIPQQIYKRNAIDVRVAVEIYRCRDVGFNRRARLELRQTDDVIQKRQVCDVFIFISTTAS